MGEMRSISNNEIEIKHILEVVLISVIVVLVVVVTFLFIMGNQIMTIAGALQPSIIQQQRHTLMPGILQSLTSPLSAMEEGKPIKSGKVYTPIILFFMRPPSIFPDQIGLINLYKRYITPNDYVITFTNANINYVNMLPGTKVFGMKSLAEIQKRVPELRGSGISVIAFDIEKNNSSAIDMANPVASVLQASQIVHQNGFKFMANPGLGANVPSIVSRIAPYSDIVLFQSQGHQRTPAEYQSFAAPSINAIRAANPKALILVQVSFMNKSAYDPNPAIMVQKVEQAYASVVDIVDGVTVFYSTNPSGQLSMMEQFYNWFQQHYR